MVSSILAAAAGAIWTATHTTMLVSTWCRRGESEKGSRIVWENIGADVRRQRSDMAVSPPICGGEPSLSLLSLPRSSQGLSRYQLPFTADAGGELLEEVGDDRCGSRDEQDLSRSVTIWVGK
jgi:hypothetical protein